MMKIQKMTKAELATMHVLWESKKPLSIKDIPAINPKLNVNTVAVAIKNLLVKEYIMVADVTYHGAALTRLFKPKVSKEQYFMLSMEAENLSPFDVISTFVKQKCSARELQQLEELIENEKKKLN